MVYSIFTRFFKIKLNYLCAVWYVHKYIVLV